MAKTKQTKFQGKIADFRNRVEKLAEQGYEPLMPYAGASMLEVRNVQTASDALRDGRGSEAIGGRSMKAAFGMFEGKQTNPKPTGDLVGTQGLGYIPYGPQDNLPNQIFQYASALPYTASALKYITDLTVALGPALMYRWTYYVNGTLRESLVPYEDAGTLIRGRLREVRNSLPADYRPAANPLPGSYEEELRTLEQDLREWERTNKEYREFVENNNIEHHYQKCIVDDSHMDIYFPTYGLSRGRAGEWNPKIVSIGHLPVVCTRMEQMDKNWRVNYVFFSEKWRQDTTAELEQKDIVAYPALMPANTLRDLRQQVALHRKTSLAKRPLWFCAPTFYPSMLKPYYPQPAWWSIFPSQVYNYAGNLVGDKASARANATMWGKIIYINLSYLKQLFDQNGVTDPEEMQRIKDGIYQKVENFLQKRENNGKVLFSDSFLTNNDTELWKAIEIVDVPQPSGGAETKEELEEISSIIFFAMGIHPALIGAVPGKSGSTGGTFQRELHLLKQQQVSPRQRIYLRFLQNICTFNGWDSHAEWIIRQQVLTTLDRNANGLEDAQSVQ